MKRFATTGVIVLLAASSLFSQELSYRDLIKRLTDLEHLATLPVPGETCRQWASWDRASKFDQATGKYVRWDANGDGQGIIRKEGEALVLAEMEGPGCIWRIWSAKPEKGRVKIFIDGAEQPVIDLPFIQYFDRTTPPFTGKALVHEVARGWNNYVPIPYQKSCKIVAEKGWGNYYHFNYITYPQGARMPTFKMPLDAQDQAALDAADQKLQTCGLDPAGKREGEQIIVENVIVEPGKSVPIARLTGARAITGIKMKMDLPATPADRSILRELAIKMTWDDAAEPAVWSPLGDFFGVAAGANKYESLPLGLTKEGLWYCYWYMPFAKNAAIELINDGTEKRTAWFEITHAPLTRPIDSLGRFHAKWHRDVFLPAEPERKIDWTMITTQGRGRYVGVMLHVWNPRGNWWGEGDEKFFVDGEKFPSTFGTGSEDYFGYAWCCPTLFTNAYHNQPISENNRGHTVVNRWHVADQVPFQKSFEGAIEKYFPNNRPTLYASIAYWYLSADGKDPYKPVGMDERTGYYASWTPPAGIKGAIEGETIKVLAKTGGNAAPQGLENFSGEWSGATHLWWTKAKVGDKLTLALPVAKPGKYKLTMQCTRAKDYAIAQISLDDKKLGDPIDFYNPNVIPTGIMSLGEHDLTQGDHKLTFEITGANEKAIKAYMLGIDYVKLEEAGK